GVAPTDGEVLRRAEDNRLQLVQRTARRQEVGRARQGLRVGLPVQQRQEGVVDLDLEVLLEGHVVLHALHEGEATAARVQELREELLGTGIDVAVQQVVEDFGDVGGVGVGEV